MSDEHAGRDRDLPALGPAGARVVDCFAAADAEALSVELLAVMADLPVADARTAIDGLLAAGLLIRTEHDWVRPAPELASQSGLAPPERVDTQSRRQLVTHLSAGVEHATALLQEQGQRRPRSTQRRTGHQSIDTRADAITWLVTHRAVLLAALAVAVQDGDGEDAIRLASWLWSLVPVTPALLNDAEWRDRLARAGENAAIHSRNPHALGLLLDLSSACAAQAGDFARAEEQRIRSTAIWRRLGEHDRLVAAVNALGVVYRDWGRLHRALDVYFELIAECQLRNDLRGHAHALHAVGLTMITAGRSDSAVEYLRRADRAFRAMPEPAPVEHAHVAVALGRIYWRQNQFSRARRCFSTALALLVDVDDQAADRVRALLSTQDGLPLPSSADGTAQ
ncbi:tetratricopeptide repeat protein [Kutzneria albida]|uniref:MalT-like TPR region domain-containing protein n=1 Tax=Kutzneria albida DSM 43870 TaxID=1449976 RepID=W5WJU1_9PSEU|nr:tetratricopeptide repeat protein [Kutzneria albida]AHI01011.1 hypothetical protein KALB_7653 [Kutzneria albida DSM 43870]